MTARICLYRGSAAVMMSALLAGSAWMKPPVDGAALACTGLLAWVLRAAEPVGEAMEATGVGSAAAGSVADGVPPAVPVPVP